MGRDGKLKGAVYKPQSGGDGGGGDFKVEGNELPRRRHQKVYYLIQKAADVMLIEKCYLAGSVPPLPPFSIPLLPFPYPPLLASGRDKAWQMNRS